jgi:hypothetical protein
VGVLPKRLTLASKQVSLATPSFPCAVLRCAEEEEEEEEEHL